MGGRGWPYYQCNVAWGVHALTLFVSNGLLLLAIHSKAK